MSPVAISATDLLGLDALNREFILLAGKDGTGKTNAVISLADFAAQITPDAQFFVIDLENKFVPALKTYYAGNEAAVPTNLHIYKADGMNDVTEAVQDVMARHQPGDWLAVESAGRAWERAQDMGYQAIQGMGKVAYMERRRAHNANLQPGQKQMSPVPKPDDLWSVVKGAHDTEFLDLISNTSTLNFIITTGVARVKENRSNRKENQDRVDFRNETGIDLNLEGAPRLPYYALTGALLERERGNVSCRVWRDNVSRLDDPAVTFDVPTRRDWATAFMTTTGRV